MALPVSHKRLSPAVTSSARQKEGFAPPQRLPTSNASGKGKWPFWAASLILVSLCS